MPIPVQCFTVIKHYRCLRSWKNQPVKLITGFFHEVKIVHTTRGPKKEDEHEEISFFFFYGKITTLKLGPGLVAMD